MRKRRKKVAAATARGPEAPIYSYNLHSSEHLKEMNH